MTSGSSPKSLPRRDEVPAEMKWRLEDIYPDNGAWESEFEKVKELAGRVGAYQGRLGESARTLLEFVRLEDDISERTSRLFIYSRMRKDEDNTNPTYQAMSDRAEALGVQVRTAMAFALPEFIAIPAETLERYIAEEPGLQMFRQYFADIMRRKPHTLTPSEEKIVALAGEVAAAPRNIYSMFNNADIKFPAIRDEEGHEVEVTKGRYIQFMESRDRRVRQDAFDALYSTYNKNRNTLATTLTSDIKKNLFHARVRNYPTALEASLHEDNIPPAVYHNLITAVRGRNPLMHRYVRLRRKLLGVDELHMYDLYTPIIKDVDMKAPYEEARETVLKGLEPLGPDYLAVLKEGMHGGWIDVMENEGKTSGAYSWGAFPTHPFVLLNYHDTIDNMFTLAHEMGHAMHSYYTFKTQPHVYANYSTFVAEVASTLNEALLMDYMLKRTTDRGQRLYLLNHYLETFRGTVFRQTMFAEFEKVIHEKAEAGEALTPDVLSGIYHNLNVDYYGPDIVVDPLIDMEWARIPHFYMTFYVFQYATGFSAATALSQQILKEGGPAVDRYIRFLSSGSSEYPIEQLKKAGVDMTTPEPVKQALDVFGRLLDEMEELLEH